MGGDDSRGGKTKPGFHHRGAEDAEINEEEIGQTEWPKSQGRHEVVVVLRRFGRLGCFVKAAARPPHSISEG
jgi:hypothetical protein